MGSAIQCNDFGSTHLWVHASNLRLLRIIFGHVTATASPNATQVPYSVRINNIATVPSGATQVQLYLNTIGTLGTGGPDIYMCSYTLPGLAAGASHVQTGSCAIPAINRAQEYYLVARFAGATTYGDRYGVPSYSRYYFGAPKSTCRYPAWSCPYPAGSTLAKAYCCK